MKNIVGVRFKKAGKIYYFDPGELVIEAGDFVIVETVRGMEYGQVVICNREVNEEGIKHPLKPVLRKATPDDRLTWQENLLKQERALRIGKEKIAEHGLDMKLLSVEYTFDGGKIIFSFTSEGRVDFRELVKDLATIFRTRIELRQIGVRDEAKFLSGIASCGRELCCASWLGDFEPVSIKMAKDQDLSLNPTKISGVCGRLMCCLNYEEEVYRELRKKLPRVGSKIDYQGTEVEVAGLNLLREQVQLRIPRGDLLELQWVSFEELQEKPPEEPKPEPKLRRRKRRKA